MTQFNIRVYGLLINEQKQVIVSDEFIRGEYYTKFPGGGLEYGEGTRDCLVREFQEEMGLSVEVGDHIYTTDFFQLSAFHPDHQILSIYYFVKALEPIRCSISTMPFIFNKDQMQQYELLQETESFRCIEWNDFSEDVVTLPIDKIVARMLKEKF
ncbi:MAG: NUDIX domain-containing protein [Chitinophagaceae bacterium]|jgi:ADP-ribose pyrophosphatase YjhB (NUDIX family)|nr:NUDIX domain-containing protein [Chitinophagaceae bacterium]